MQLASFLVMKRSEMKKAHKKIRLYFCCCKKYRRKFLVLCSFINYEECGDTFLKFRRCFLQWGKNIQSRIFHKNHCDP